MSTDFGFIEFVYLLFFLPIFPFSSFFVFSKYKLHTFQKSDHRLLPSPAVELDSFG